MKQFLAFSLEMFSFPTYFSINVQNNKVSLFVMLLIPSLRQCFPSCNCTDWFFLSLIFCQPINFLVYCSYSDQFSCVQSVHQGSARVSQILKKWKNRAWIFRNRSSSYCERVRPKASSLHYSHFGPHLQVKKGWKSTICNTLL